MLYIYIKFIVLTSVVCIGERKKWYAQTNCVCCKHVYYSFAACERCSVSPLFSANSLLQWFCSYFGNSTATELGMRASRTYTLRFRVVTLKDTLNSIVNYYFFDHFIGDGHHQYDSQNACQ